MSDITDYNFLGQNLEFQKHIEKAIFFHGDRNIKNVLNGKEMSSDEINNKHLEFEQHEFNILNLKNEKKELLSKAKCPCCGNNNISFRYHTINGHGDSGFDSMRIFCNDCTTSQGNIYGWGSPTIENEIELLKLWVKTI